MKSYTLTLDEDQLLFLRDMLEGMLEKMEEDLKHYRQHPDELGLLAEPGEEPVTLDDFEASRDEMKTFLKLLPVA